jgi:hypothetical protein
VEIVKLQIDGVSKKSRSTEGDRYDRERERERERKREKERERVYKGHVSTSFVLTTTKETCSPTNIYLASF